MGGAVERNKDSLSQNLLFVMKSKSIFLLTLISWSWDSILKNAVYSLKGSLSTIPHPTPQCSG